MKDAILQALQQLNPEDDNQWTGEGLPRVEIVKDLAGVAWLTREQITTAAPDMSRQALREYLATQAPAVATQAIVPVVQPPQEPIVAPAAAQPQQSNELDALQATLVGVQLRLSDAEQAVAEAIKLRNRVQDEESVLLSQIEKLTAQDVHRPVNEIQKYLDSQKRLAAARAGLVREVLVDTRAPIDKQLASRPRGK